MFRLPLIAAMFAFFGVVFAQTHQHPQEPVIDGKVSPDLIPDLVAYRLFFASISPHDQDTVIDLERRAGQVVMIRLDPDDQKALILAMADYGAQYRVLVHDYNAAASAAWANNAQSVDPAIKQQFLIRRDQLVQSTMSTLNANLSVAGWLRLVLFVKGEKANMKIQGN